MGDPEGGSAGIGAGMSMADEQWVGVAATSKGTGCGSKGECMGMMDGGTAMAESIAIDWMEIRIFL